MHYPDDDGAVTDVRKLQTMGASPVALDTRAALCMFDGSRGHFVEHFSGNRYSLVFFTHPSYQTASRDALLRLRELGASLPTEASIKHFERLLAPARGYLPFGGKQRSIQNCLFCREDKPQFLQWKTASFNSMGSGALEHALSFVLCPTVMATLCAVSRKLEQIAWRPSSWRGTLVGTTEPARPRGARAHSHYKLWSLTAGILVRQWQFRSCAFLVYGGYMHFVERERELERSGG